MPLKIGIAGIEFNNLSNTLLVAGSGKPGAPELLSLTINPDSAGNNVWKMAYDRALKNTSGGILDGFTLETSIDGSTWFTCDKTNMTAVIMFDQIEVTNTAPNDTEAISMDSLHKFRLSYNQGAGNITNKNHTADVLETFSATDPNDTINNSTISITRGQGPSTGVSGDHYGLTEAANVTRDPVQNPSIAAYDMASTNNAGVRTAPDGSANAYDMDETGSLQSTDAWATEDADNNSMGVWIIIDTLPSTLNAGAGRDGYVFGRWKATNDRAWIFNIWGRQIASIDNLPQISIKNSNNNTFVQRRATAVPTATWFYLGASHDSSGDASAGETAALKMFYQEYGDSTTFETIQNAVLGTLDSGDMDVNTVPVPSSIGVMVDLPADLIDGGVSQGFCAYGVTFTTAEHTAIAEKPRAWPYFIDLV